MSKDIYIIGSGGHAQVVAQTIKLCGSQPIFISALPQDTVDSKSIDEKTFLEQPPAGDWKLICGVGSIGSMMRRKELLNKYAAHRDHFTTVIHPSAILDTTVVLMPGVFVGPGAILNHNARIDRDAIINTAAIVEHDVEIGDNVHVASGARILGGAVVKCDSLIGGGSTILQGIVIGTKAIVGAGAVCVRDIPDDSGTWLGVPADNSRRGSDANKRD